LLDINIRQGTVSRMQFRHVSEASQLALLTRFGLGGDALKSYKATISRWLWPDIFKNQDTSVATAKKAISDYKKAIGRPEELAELMTFYCEQAAGFSNEGGLEDEGYYDALVRMFAQALKISVGLPETQRDVLLKRLDQARCICHQFGYGVGDAMDELLVDYGIDD
jgi:hypothetical protein